MGIGLSLRYLSDDCLWRGLNSFSYFPFIDTTQLSGNKVWLLVSGLSREHLTWSLIDPSFLDLRYSTMDSLMWKNISCLFLIFLITPTNISVSTILLGIISLRWHMTQAWISGPRFMHLLWKRLLQWTHTNASAFKEMFWQEASQRHTVFYDMFRIEFWSWRVFYKTGCLEVFSCCGTLMTGDGGGGKWADREFKL